MSKLQDFNQIIKMPYLDATDVQKILGVSYMEANGIIKLAYKQDVKSNNSAGFQKKASIQSICKVVDMEYEDFCTKLKKAIEES